VHSHTWSEITDPDTAAEDIFRRKALLWNAVTDTDGVPVVDTDGVGVYDTIGPVDNPLVPTVTFTTVAEMLAYPGSGWDTAQTLNWAGTDGNRQHWVMLADPAAPTNATDRLATDDGWGVAQLTTARGRTSGEQFASLDEVDAAVAAARYVHHQTTPATSWEIVHPLGGRPSVTLLDDSGRKVYSGIQYLFGDTTIIASFSTPRTGYAHLS
jgi:hypothetical protein